MHSYMYKREIWFGITKSTWFVMGWYFGSGRLKMMYITYDHRVDFSLSLVPVLAVQKSDTKDLSKNIKLQKLVCCYIYYYY